MVVKLNARGICGTCINQSDCFSLKRNMKERKSIIHCEEFDDSESIKKEESQRLVNDFATLPCISIKNLIPWNS